MTTSSNSFPTSGDGLVSSTALQTVIQIMTQTQGLVVFGYNASGAAEITYGSYSNDGLTFGSTTGMITITVCHNFSHVWVMCGPILCCSGPLPSHSDLLSSDVRDNLICRFFFSRLLWWNVFPHYCWRLRTFFRVSDRRIYVASYQRNLRKRRRENALECCDTSVVIMSCDKHRHAQSAVDSLQEICTLTGIWVHGLGEQQAWVWQDRKYVVSKRNLILACKTADFAVLLTQCELPLYNRSTFSDIACRYLMPCLRGCAWLDRPRVASASRHRRPGRIMRFSWLAGLVKG